jgi:hypothetical protein
MAGEDEERAEDERTGVGDRAETRSRLLPEERAVGSADPEEQAKQVLRESEERTDAPESTIVRRHPEDTV